MRKITIIAALAIVAMASCKKEDSSTVSQADAIEFVSESIATRVNSAGDEWTEGDLIGVYMVDDATSIEYANYQYEALTGGESTTRFTAVSETEALKYCEGSMEFYAYYPYNEMPLIGEESTGTEIDCSDQSKADFLWATTGAYRGDVIALPFEHMMSRLELVITPLDNITDLGGLEASITGVLTKGECTDITTGEVVGTSGDDVELTFMAEEYVEDAEAESGYSLSESGSADMVSATVILFPQTLASSAAVSVTVGDRSFSINIPSGSEFTSGMQHRYYVAVGNDHIEFAGDNTIEEWGDEIVGSDDLHGEYNPY